MSGLRKLLSRHVAFSLLKQVALNDLLGEHSWSLDVDAGAVDFGDDRVYPVQIIGTESGQSGTWLWAWANDESGIPLKLLECAETLRDLGR